MFDCLIGELLTLPVPAGEGTEVLKGLGDVKCISFSRNGRLLAVGCEDGSLQVLEWPSLQTRKLIRSAWLHDSN